MHAPAALHLEDTHTPDAVLALMAFGSGLVGLLLVAIDAAFAGMLVGAFGVFAGLTGQYLSRTTAERFLDVIGLVAAALAFAIGAANAGLTFS